MALLPTSSCLSGADPMRCIAHIDMDCFYAQVEAVRLGVDCRVTPLVVAQWGSLIAVNYPARARGVKRFNNVAEAQALCPGLVVALSPSYRMGESVSQYHPHPVQDSYKISLEPYRHASRQVFSILAATPGIQVEKGSIDEAYIDVTEAARRELAEVRAAAAGASLDPLADVMEPSTRLIEDRRAEMEAWFGARGTSLAAVFDEPMRALVRGECGAELEGSRAFCVGADDAAYAERCLLLCAASRVVHRLRQRIYAELHYDCSAGIAHNRVLAKCISATHKPNQQTLLLPDRSASALFELPLSGVRGFGGKLGAAVSAVCGGVTECREAWLVPLAQLCKLDGACDVGDGEDAEDDTEGRVGRLYGRKRGRAASPSMERNFQGLAAHTTSQYVFYRLRGLGGDTVADPALPRGMRASKIFHPACSSWSAAQLWMAPLAGELWHRFSEYESRYHKEGRSLVLLFRTHVTPEQARRGQHARSYRAQVPLPTSVRDAKEIAGMGLRELVKLMRKVTTGSKGGERRAASLTPLPSPHILTKPPSDVPDAPPGTAAPSSGVLTMPPLHVIELSIIGLRPRPLQATEGSNDGITGGADGETSAAPQRSLVDMFSALSASAAASARTKASRTAVPGGGVLRRRRRSGSRDGEVARGLGREVVVEIDDGDEDENVSDDCVDFDVHLGEAPEVKGSDTACQREKSAGLAGASSPPLMRTLEDLFCRATAAPSASAAETVSVPTRAVREVTTVCVEEDDAIVWVPQRRCASITEVSPEEDVMIL
ncbi:putative DNA polymerase eta [Leishmania mexicana MHOM/GT/2001/U1103]|uniref:DNA polymerase eta n=1 Tax=Leishmania mexicana (strain MHOM/GT/2001/U1103) TaxID=929439 RepID=E9AV29_LEIMU|nr:putative DNA polymerase eta [Leishmania mexicana MHOM/GT/2001/U1103]CBZ26810.1 putative DNA polymerase eta [Leishmania mexicana MHOM/GT/2001/U1103]